MNVSFNAKDHSYWAGSRKVSSVTEILRAVGLYDSYQFSEDVHRWRGTAVHQFCAILDLGGKPVLGPVAPKFKQVAEDIVHGYGAAFAQFKKDTGWQGRIWECAFIDPVRSYAGCFDSVGEMGGEYWLLDVKSGMLPEMVPVQLAMYWLLATKGQAVDEQHPGLEWLRAIIQSGAPVRRMALRLEKTGKYTVSTQTTKGEDYSAAKWLQVASSVLNVYAVKASYGLIEKRG